MYTTCYFHYREGFVVWWGRRGHQTIRTKHLGSGYNTRIPLSNREEIGSCMAAEVMRAFPIPPSSLLSMLSWT